MNLTNLRFLHAQRGNPLQSLFAGGGGENTTEPCVVLVVVVLLLVTTHRNADDDDDDDDDDEPTSRTGGYFVRPLTCIHASAIANGVVLSSSLVPPLLPLLPSDSKPTEGLRDR